MQETGVRRAILDAILDARANIQQCLRKVGGKIYICEFLDEGRPTIIIKNLILLGGDQF